MRVPKPVVVIFVALALSLVGMNIALVRQDRRLASENKAYEARFHVNVGERVPALSGRGPTGRRVTVGYAPGTSSTLLLIYAPSCAECALNWPTWEKLIQRIDLRRIRVIGVSVESSGLSGQFLDKVGLGEIKTALLPDFGSIISYRFQYTPQTILIGSDRRVEGIWSGVLSAQEVMEVERSILSGEAGARSASR